MICNFRVSIRSCHLNQWWLFSSLEENFVGRECSYNHFCDSIEDSSFPIIIVRAHLWSTLIIGFNSAFFDWLEIHISNILVVFYQFNNLLVEISVKIFREFTKIHWLFAFEIYFSNYNSVFDINNLLLNVLSMLKDTWFGFLELINSLLAITDILRNWKREPIMVFSSLVHPSIQLSDLFI